MSTYLNHYQSKYKQMALNLDRVTFYLIFLLNVFDNQIVFVHKF